MGRAAQKYSRRLEDEEVSIWEALAVCVPGGKMAPQAPDTPNEQCPHKRQVAEANSGTERRARCTQSSRTAR